MAGDCEFNVWEWKDRSFPFPFPNDLGPRFLSRFDGKDKPAVVDAQIALIRWLGFRTRECFAWEDTRRWASPPPRRLTLHVFPPEADGELFGGFAFDGDHRRVHAMALWHRTDALDANQFVQRALPETAAMSR